MGHREAKVWLRSRTAAKDAVLLNAGIDPNAFWREARRGFPAFRSVMDTKQKRSAVRRAA